MYCFDAEYAKAYGLEEAVMIHHFQFWINKNVTEGRNAIDGRTWTYASLAELQQYFPFMTPDRVRRTAESLVKQNVLLKGNYNKSQYDRTTWFAFVNEPKFLAMLPIRSGNFEQLDSAELPNGSDEIARPIPDSITHSITDTNTSSSEVPNKEQPQSPPLKGKKGKQLKPKYSDEDSRLAKLLHEYIKKRDPKSRDPNWNTWATSIEQLHRIDGRSYEDIECVIRWCQADPFWQNNILSTSKLRIQFKQLFLKFQNHAGNNTTARGNTAGGNTARSKQGYRYDPKERDADAERFSTLFGNAPPVAGTDGT